LRFFRHGAAPAVAGMDAFKHAQFLGNLDRKIVSVLFLLEGKAKNSAFYTERFGEALLQMMNKAAVDQQ
jgi:hypothetical protein